MRGATPAVGSLPSYALLIALAVPIVVHGLFPEQFIRIADLAAAGLIDSRGLCRLGFPGGRELMSRYLNNILLALVGRR